MQQLAQALQPLVAAASLAILSSTPRQAHRFRRRHRRAHRTSTLLHRPRAPREAAAQARRIAVEQVDQRLRDEQGQVQAEAASQARAAISRAAPPTPPTPSAGLPRNAVPIQRARRSRRGWRAKQPCLARGLFRRCGLCAAGFAQPGCRR
ncbi:MAG: hypothetical protein ABIO45_14055 [Burkholderiaceae bacterium]